MTLDKTDLQKFFKRLRKLCPNSKIKYYAVGEYGTKNERPHYHAIIFNVSDSSHYFQAWTLNGKPIGSVHVGNVTNSSVAYTMKYIDKPHWHKKHSRDDRQKQFPVMSKGLGGSYINDAVRSYHANLGNNCVTLLGGVKVPMPKYYRDKLLTDDQKEEQRKIISERVEQKRLKDYRIFMTSDEGKRYDYAFFKESEREARNTRFYKNQKNRDI